MAKKSVAFLVLILTVGFGVLLPPDAGATRYTVAQCGWHVGQDASWADTSDDKFTRSSYCQTPASADPFEDVHLTSETRGSSTFVAGTRFSRWRWQAPAGTGIVTVHAQRWQYLHDGFRHRIGSVSSGGAFSPFAEYTDTDSVKRDFAGNFSPFASALESRLLCAKAASKVCSADAKSVAGLRGLTITIDDSNRPSTAIGGPLSTGNWLRGAQSLSFSANDSGSGLRYGQTVIDGSVRAQTEHACEKAFIAGQWRGTKMQPCRVSASGVHTVQTSGLSDGPHRLSQCAIDFATNSACLPDRTIRVDNTAPTSPRALAVEGGEDWHRLNGFRLDWRAPDQGVASPIAGYVYRAKGEPGFDSGLVPAFGPGPIPAVKVPSSGRYKISVWLVDLAGNSNPASAAEATLKLDEVPPAAYFEDPSAERPESLRVPVSDTHSGPAGGVIAYRRQGSDSWRRLATDFTTGPTGQALEATFPSAEVPDGIYEFQALVLDHAGNVTMTKSRANRSPMTLRAPSKRLTEITARLNHDGRGALEMKIPFGAAARVTGRLTDSNGVPIPGAAVEISQSPSPGSATRPEPLAVMTDHDGYFAATLDRGPSRRVTARFRGTAGLADSSAGPLGLRVKGRVGLRVSPRRLRTGHRVKLRGKVSADGARRPPRGHLVAIQYLERSTDRWRPVLVARTNHRGRYHASYRFRYITGIARIRLRAVLLASQYFPYESAASKTVRVLVKGARARGGGARQGGRPRKAAEGRRAARQDAGPLLPNGG